MTDLFGHSTAVLSECQQYRYRLDRDLGSGTGTFVVLSLNPSTADAEKNDPTIRKDMGFGRRWGFRRLIKGNLFGYRSTDKRRLLAVADPVGAETDRHLIEIAALADGPIVCAWGAYWNPIVRQRAEQVRVLLKGYRLHVLGVNSDGSPEHPLYIPYERELQEWRP